MEIRKSVNFQSIKEGLETLEKLKKKKEILALDFSGSLNKQNKTERFVISWIEEEEIQ